MVTRAQRPLLLGSWRLLLLVAKSSRVFPKTVSKNRLRRHRCHRSCNRRVLGTPRTWHKKHSPSQACRSGLRWDTPMLSQASVTLLSLRHLQTGSGSSRASARRNSWVLLGAHVQPWAHVGPSGRPGTRGTSQSPVLPLLSFPSPLRSGASAWPLPAQLFSCASHGGLTYLPVNASNRCHPGHTFAGCTRSTPSRRTSEKRDVQVLQPPPPRATTPTPVCQHLTCLDFRKGSLGLTHCTWPLCEATVRVVGNTNVSCFL